jgi:transcription elongation factor GreA
MATAEKVPMLAEGHRKLSAELKRLKGERPEIVEAIEVARAHGDLSENAEYHAAKERQGQIEASIADLEDKLSRAMVIDPTTLSPDSVVGSMTRARLSLSSRSAIIASTWPWRSLAA